MKRALIELRATQSENTDGALESGCTVIPGPVEAMLKRMYGEGIKVLGLNGYTEQLIWLDEGWDSIPKISYDASEEAKEVNRRAHIDNTKTITLTNLIESFE